ncbi:protein immune deficiency [Coccinella septempunctata]|uniref:protein immune deficiency n=1 Tax=Coccinella septempunctata TaxID=41139 RepID=UPI001D074114|nr:protein immune deficiency [Coccinella septempunctata]
MSALDEEDLTTDAFASPPRDDVQNESNSTSQNGINDTETRRRHSDGGGKSSQRHKGGSESDDSDPSNPRKCCSDRRFSSKSHEGYHGPNAYASVINISNATGIQIGSNFTYYINSPNDAGKKTPKRSKDVPKTEKITLLLNSEERVTEKDIQFLSAHIDATWMETARKLDYSEGQISQFYCDFINIGLKEVIYQFLLDWIRNNGKNATVGKLAEALWNSDQRQCVSKWSQK